jgi:hypothetical protein
MREAVVLVSGEGDELPGKIALFQRRLIGSDGREQPPEKQQPEQDQRDNGEEISAAFN